MKKITRIAYNSAGWHHPTGDAAQHEKSRSFSQENGFGLEEWLFRDDWEIDGWRYAFLQGVNDSRAKLVRNRTPFDVTLFTLQPDKRRRYVANINGAECLDDTQAVEALSAFKSNGWFATMQREIRAVHGKVQALENNPRAQHVLNVRFRLKNVDHFPNDAFASPGDPIQKRSRYLLMDVDGLRQKFIHANGREGSEGFPSIAGHTRSGTVPVQVTPEHARMQSILMEQLQAEFPTAKVVREENYIDVLVKTDDEVRLYEIKSDLAPRTVLRLAVGQLLEYAYFRFKGDARKVTLISVGRNQLSEDDQNYLAHLRDSVGLPLEYRVVRV